MKIAIRNKNDYRLKEKEKFKDFCRTENIKRHPSFAVDPTVGTVVINNKRVYLN